MENVWLKWVQLRWQIDWKIHLELLAKKKKQEEYKKI